MTAESKRSQVFLTHSNNKGLKPSDHDVWLSTSEEKDVRSEPVVCGLFCNDGGKGYSFVLPNEEGFIISTDNWVEQRNTPAYYLHSAQEVETHLGKDGLNIIIN